MVIRDARPDEREALEALQMAASLVWADTRDQLLANPDVVELPAEAIAERRLRVAVDDGDEPLGFSLVLASVDGVVELDGLFVTPDRQHTGIGSALMDDLVATAESYGAAGIEVTAGPATAFYERHGFVVTGKVQTRFAEALRLRLQLAVTTDGHGTDPLSKKG